MTDETSLYLLNGYFLSKRSDVTHAKMLFARKRLSDGGSKTLHNLSKESNYYTNSVGTALEHSYFSIAKRKLWNILSSTLEVNRNDYV